MAKRTSKFIGKQIVCDEKMWLVSPASITRRVLG